MTSSGPRGRTIEMSEVATTTHVYKGVPPRAEPGEALGDYAYRALRETILEGRFRPRAHLRESEVARWLAISRTPVREALHRMASEGLLTSGSWSGLMIAEPDREQLVELYGVREVLEGTAAALAARNASEAEIALLNDIVAREEDALDEPARMVVIDSELHHTIHVAAHNRYLLQALVPVMSALGVLRQSTFRVPGSSRKARRDHQAILRAIRERNAKRAEAVTRRHIRDALELRLDLHDRHVEPGDVGPVERVRSSAGHLADVAAAAGSKRT